MICPDCESMGVVEMTTPKGLRLVPCLLCNGSGIVHCWEGERINDAITRSKPEQIPGPPILPSHYLGIEYSSRFFRTPTSVLNIRLDSYVVLE